MRKTIGVAAHVDAGKTTFSEQVLFRTNAIRKAGRVDHRDSFLDLHPIERERGITVFSDQAVFDLNGDRYYWVDTPGHADLTSEMERVLPVLDYAVLLVSCPEGVESHTETVWELLRAANVPTLIFVNKTDRTDADFDRCFNELRTMLSGDVIDLRGYDGTHLTEDICERIAETDEALLERFLEGDTDPAAFKNGLTRAVRSRSLFPVLAGSALQDEGIDRFLSVLSEITDTDYEARAALPLGGRVFKLRRDERGMRQVYIKLTQGTLSVRDEITLPEGTAKVSEIRIVHGGKSRSVDRAEAGDIVCIPGLNGVRPGDGVGVLSDERTHMHSEPMLRVSVSVPPEVPKTRLAECLHLLEEEDPTLQVEHHERTGSFSLRIMGGIQTDVLTRIGKERFGLSLTFGAPQILYKETVAERVVGIGHYEPLKHYAEVWLRLVPTERNSGITFKTLCHVDKLALNWQRLIETHVFEKQHPGVLTGAPLTDVRIELLAGRAHLKHTEGGDFRESTYRAIRNALMQAKNILLEPVCRFTLRVPAQDYGRIGGDLTRMNVVNEHVRPEGDRMIVEGECPFAKIADYPEKLRELTHGRGSIRMNLNGYMPCVEQNTVVEASGYEPTAEESPDSVFCSHGAGHIVPWYEVRANAHCEVEDV